LPGAAGVRGKWGAVCLLGMALHFYEMKKKNWSLVAQQCKCTYYYPTVNLKMVKMSQGWWHKRINPAFGRL
jgi:hypothetical protein